jgi:hypothetical protein
MVTQTFEQIRLALVQFPDDMRFDLLVGVVSQILASDMSLVCYAQACDWTLKHGQLLWL